MKHSVFALGLLVLGVVFSPPTLADDRRDDNDRYEYRDHYRGHDGYRHRPYDRHRHYRRHQHREHRYEYHGHWRSWDEFDRYMERHPDMRHHGHYYHDGMHLMFRTCPPDSGMCIFFSIGR